MQYGLDSYSLLKFGSWQAKAMSSYPMVTDVLVLSDPDSYPQAHSVETDVIRLGQRL